MRHIKRKIASKLKRKERKKWRKRRTCRKKTRFLYTEEDTEYMTKQTPISTRHLAVTKSRPESVSVYMRIQERDNFILIPIMSESSPVPWDL